MTGTLLDIDEAYCILAEKYGWTFNEIAEMSPEQKRIALRGRKIVEMDDEQLEQFMQRRMLNG